MVDQQLAQAALLAAHRKKAVLEAGMLARLAHLPQNPRRRGPPRWRSALNPIPLCRPTGHHRHPGQQTTHTKSPTPSPKPHVCNNELESDCKQQWAFHD